MNRNKSDVYFSSKVGILKAFDSATSSVANVCQCKGNDFSSIVWRDETEQQIIFPNSSNVFPVFDTLSGSWNEILLKSIKTDSTRVISCSSLQNHLFVAKTSGVVKLFDHKNYNLLFDERLDNIQAARYQGSYIAGGGKGCNIHVWDINKSKPIFIAKNMRRNVIDLECPVWISDVCFVPNYGEKLLLSASKFGEFCLFDLRLDQRRPVTRVAWRQSSKHGKLRVGRGVNPAHLPDMEANRPISSAVTFASAGCELRVAAGNSLGEVCLIDLRLPKGILRESTDVTHGADSGNKSHNSTITRNFGVRAPEYPSRLISLPGASGAVSGLACSGAFEANIPHTSCSNAAINGESVLLVASIDRFLRIYSTKTAKRLGKIYIGVPINGFIIHKNADLSKLIDGRAADCSDKSKSNENLKRKRSADEHDEENIDDNSEDNYSEFKEDCDNVEYSDGETTSSNKKMFDGTEEDSEDDDQDDVVIEPKKSRLTAGEGRDRLWDRLTVVTDDQDQNLKKISKTVANKTRKQKKNRGR